MSAIAVYLTVFVYLGIAVCGGLIAAGIVWVASEISLARSDY